MEASMRPLLAHACVAAMALVVGNPARGLAGPHSSLASAPVAAGQSAGVEKEQTLYVQAPDWSGPKGDSIVLVWLPGPLESTCLGKTMKECFNVDIELPETIPRGLKPRSFQAVYGTIRRGGSCPFKT